MKITRKSQLTGMIHTLDIDVTDEQLENYLHNRLPLRVCFPNLVPADIEFIVSGITQEEADELERSESETKE